MQRAWDKYGAEAFVFEVVEACAVEVLSEREAWHLAQVSMGLRLTIAVDTKVAARGLGHSSEARRKMKEAHAGRWAKAPPEKHQERSEIAKQVVAKPHVRAAMVAGLRTPEARQRNREAQLASHAANPERAIRLSETMKKNHTVERGLRLSIKRGGRAIVGFNKENKETKRYEYTEMVKRDGFNPDAVRSVLKGRVKSHLGWTWSYVAKEEAASLAASLDQVVT
jgi:hypothetical protein